MTISETLDGRARFKIFSLRWNFALYNSDGSFSRILISEDTIRNGDALVSSSHASHCIRGLLAYRILSLQWAFLEGRGEIRVRLLLFLVDVRHAKVHERNLGPNVEERPEALPVCCSIMIHNGRDGPASHFEPVLPLEDGAPRRRIIRDPVSADYSTLDCSLQQRSKRQMGQRKRSYDRYTFMPKWLVQFPWLTQTTETCWGCIICARHPALRGRDSFALGKNESPRIDKIKMHDLSQQHKACKLTDDRSTQHLEQLEDSLGISAQRSAMELLVHTVYYVLKSDRPFDDIPGIMRLHRATSMPDMTLDYENNTFWDSVLRIVSADLQQKETAEIKQSMDQYGVSIIGDGSATRSQIETEIIYLRYFGPGGRQVKTRFFSLSAIPRGSTEARSTEARFGAENVFAAYVTSICSQLPSFFNDLQHFLVSCCFDGASTMLGIKGGVARKMQDLAPKATIYHAVAHRLELAYGDSVSSCEYLPVVQEALSETYRFFHTSAKHVDGLKLMHGVLDVEEPLIKHVSTHGIRWMASKHRAIKALLRSYQSVQAYLEKEAYTKAGLNLTSNSPSADFVHRYVFVRGAETGRISKYQVVGISKTCPTNNLVLLNRQTKNTLELTRAEVATYLASDRLAVLQGFPEWELYLKLSDLRTLKIMVLLYDITSILSVLSMKFQRDGIALPEVPVHVNSAIAALEQLQRDLGSVEKEFDHELKVNPDALEYRGVVLERLGGYDEEVEQRDRELILGDLINSLRSRFDPFCENVVVKASAVFQPINWPPLDEIKKQGVSPAAYGVSELSVLYEHFKHLKCMSDFNIDGARTEWFRLKVQVQQMEQRYRPFAEFWTHFLQHVHTGDDQLGFPCMCKLIRLLLLTVVDTSCCERGFSLMNRIQTGPRNQLKLDSLDCLMRVSMNGPEIEDFDPAPILKAWQAQRNRRKTKPIPHSRGISQRD